MKDGDRLGDRANELHVVLDDDERGLPVQLVDDAGQPLDILGAQAAAAGVAPTALTSSRFCTSCGPGDLHSHRASGGKAGRMAAFLGLRSD